MSFNSSQTKHSPNFGDDSRKKNHLPKIRPVKCNTCGECFSYKSELRIHSQFHVKGSAYESSTQEKGFVSHQVQNQHIIHRGFKCNICRRSFEFVFQLIFHKLHACSLKKNQTHSQTLTNYERKDHDKLHSNRMSSKCDEHDAVVSDTAGMIGHKTVNKCQITGEDALQEANNITDTATTANVAHLSCKSNASLTGHDGIRESENPSSQKDDKYTSEYSGNDATIRQPQPLIRTDKHTASLSDPKIQLEDKITYSEYSGSQTHCYMQLDGETQSYKNANDLISPNRDSTDNTNPINHSNGNPFPCKIYKSRRNYESKLLIHSRIHFGERPYKCLFCEKSFITQELLNIHMVLHEAQHFKCLICRKLFATTEELQVHKTTHKSVRILKPQVKCVICGKMVFHKYLKRHNQRTHSHKINDNCKISLRPFNYELQLKRHLTVADRDSSVSEYAINRVSSTHVEQKDNFKMTCTEMEVTNEFTLLYNAAAEIDNASHNAIADLEIKSRQGVK